MHLALALHLAFIAVLLGQPALHLTEAAVVQFGGVGVDAGDGAVRRSGQPRRLGERAVGVIGGVERHQDALQ